MKIIYIILGWISFLIGLIGVVLPILPTTPFWLLTTFCFAKGSPKFHNWFISTKLYKKHLEDFVKHREMTLKKKVILLAFASAMLMIPFYLVDFWHARLAIILVMIAKYYYFIFRIKTVKEENQR